MSMVDFSTIDFKHPLAKTKCFFNGDVGFGECYVDGWLDVEGDLSDFIQANYGKGFRLLPYLRKSTSETSHHYNIPARFYEIMLGESMVYTCANFDGGQISLLKAQEKKYRQHADWLELNGTQSLLECGFGWGSFSSYLDNLVDQYTGLTVADDQSKYARENSPAKRTGTSFLTQSWNQHHGRYDRFTSICMLEHVGKNDLQYYFNWIDLCLKYKGVGTLQFITSDTDISPWADKYIFPGAYEPNLNEALRMIKRAGLKVTDLIERGGDYVLTLKAWLNNIESNIDVIKKIGFDDKFIRMFRLYLSGGIAAFRSGNSQLIQLRFVKI